MKSLHGSLPNLRSKLLAESNSSRPSSQRPHNNTTTTCPDGFYEYQKDKDETIELDVEAAEKVRKARERRVGNIEKEMNGKISRYVALNN